MCTISCTFALGFANLHIYTNYNCYGLQGTKGASGVSGPRGQTGATGQKGNTGLSGPPGIPGTKQKVAFRAILTDTTTSANPLKFAAVNDNFIKYRISNSELYFHQYFHLS